MWKSLLKQIWAQRYANSWVGIELVIVIVLLWYAIDLVYNYEGAALQPKGYDTESVFDLTVNLKPGQEKDSVLMSHSSDYIWQIYNLVKHYPGVCEACYYYGSIPYTDQITYEGYASHTDSTHVTGCYIRYVNPTYFKVFHLKSLSGTFHSDQWKESEYPMPVLMSVSLCDSVFHSSSPVGETCFNPYFIGSNNPITNYKVMAVLPKHKLGDYERYEPFIYLPASEQMGWWCHIAFRVNTNQLSDFRERFLEDMQSKLAIGPFYLENVQSYSNMKRVYDLETGTVNYLNTTYAVIAFFMFNVFLSILGTFWYRMRRRRGEIALRMALGSTRKNVFGYYVLESIFLLLIAAIPAVIICINIDIADLTVHTLMEPTTGRFIFCFLSVLILLSIIILCGVWFPARNAMNLQPVEALHEEG